MTINLIQYVVGSAFAGNFSNPYAQQPRAGLYATIAAALVAPTSRGNVTIRSADTAEAPVINPNWLATVTDQKVAVAAYRRARAIFLAQAMAPVIFGEEYFPGSGFETDAEILGLIKNTMMTLYHASCTCKMGTREDRLAVVDTQARVFGVTHLRVVDASAFPILPPGHPQSTVCELPFLTRRTAANRLQDMLAEKIAADIVSNRPK